VVNNHGWQGLRKFWIPFAAWGCGGNLFPFDVYEKALGRQSDMYGR
jgi:hypothetical protein